VEDGRKEGGGSKAGRKEERNKGRKMKDGRMIGG
jgi:hypothetical protein